MKNDLCLYRRSVKRLLRCGRDTKKNLLNRLDASLSLLQQDEPNPSMQRLTDGFGPPEAMAKELMAGVGASELNKYRRNRILCVVAAILLFLALCAVGLWLYYRSATPMIIQRASGGVISGHSVFLGKA